LAHNGFEGYSVLKFVSTPDPNTQSPYSVQATLNVKSIKDFQEVLGATDKVLGDVPNFSNKGPTLMIVEKMA
jgi:hypothetical protein